MSPGSLNDPGFVVDQFEHSVRHGYLEVASLTILIWDYVLTLPREIDLVWRQLKGWTTVLFAMNRYFIFVGQVVNTVAYVSPNANYTVSKLSIAYWINSVTCIFQIILTDSIVWYCVSALYLNSKRVRWPLLVLLVVSILSGTVVTVVVGNRIEDTGDPAPGLTRCTVLSQFHDLWLFWLPILVYEATTLVLVAWQFYGNVRDTRKQAMTESPLVRLVTRQTMLYLLVVFIMFIANAVVNNHQDPSLAIILTPATTVVLSILGNRMMFSLRQELRVNVGGRTDAHTTINLGTWHAARPQESTIMAMTTIATRA
ncbi:hypothetical protein E1B28_002052 [Marasmius oreades]|uniref:DUF6533 domain-containing protein n=1 Tax=Marasmius oreades TaxID=181124 RepID=A0A9P7V4W3_9AGAR|nr:uncharacterized protein E1B28_002052 [Marasmius oreades]KAG7100279.1 hypothetical protein E1B28_002052 [Marasmius oreades]